MTSLEGSVLQRFFSEENNESWTLSWFASVFFQVLFFVKGSDLHSWKIIGIYNIGIYNDRLWELCIELGKSKETKKGYGYLHIIFRAQTCGWLNQSATTTEVESILQGPPLQNIYPP